MHDTYYHVASTRRLESRDIKWLRSTWAMWFVLFLWNRLSFPSNTLNSQRTYRTKWLATCWQRWCRIASGAGWICNDYFMLAFNPNHIISSWMRIRRFMDAFIRALVLALCDTNTQHIQKLARLQFGSSRRDTRLATGYGECSHVRNTKTTKTKAKV